MKWFVTMDGPIVGVEGHDLVEADSEVEAEQQASELAYEWLTRYFDILDTEAEEGDGEWGHDYIFQDEVSYAVEKYKPTEHDEYLF